MEIPHSFAIQFRWSERHELEVVQKAPRGITRIPDGQSR